MIEIKNLTIMRGDRRVVENLNYRFENGKSYWIAGENGSGKSTLISAISGDLPYLGEIHFDGEELRNLDLQKLRSLRSVLLQDLSIDFPITTMQALELVTPDRNKIEEIAKTLDVTAFLDRKVTELSKGQLQRVFIAQALLQDSSHLLLDEPFSAQDEAHIAALTEVFKSERDSGRTLVVVSHIDLESRGLADHKLSLN